MKETVAGGAVCRGKCAHEGLCVSKKNVSGTEKMLAMRHRVLSVAQGVVICCVMSLGSGCVSYHPAPGGSLKGEKAYSLIDSVVKREATKWTGPGTSLVGADSRGFTRMELGRDGPVTLDTLFLNGRAVHHKYADIEDITVRANMAGIILCGILDPTGFSEVTVTVKGGEDITFERPLYPFQSFFPAWLFSSQLQWASRLGKALQNAKAEAQGGVPDAQSRGGRDDFEREVQQKMNSGELEGMNELQVTYPDGSVHKFNAK